MAIKTFSTVNTTISNNNTILILGKNGFRTYPGSIPIICDSVEFLGKDTLGNATDIKLNTRVLSALYDDNHKEHVLEVNDGNINYQLVDNGTQGLSFTNFNMYSIGNVYNIVNRYLRENVNDVTTSKQVVNPFYLGNKDANISSFHVPRRGGSIFLLGEDTRKIYKYNNPSRTILDFTYDHDLLLSNLISTPKGLFFSDSGKSMYISSNTTVYEYSLVFPFELKGANLSGRYKNLSSLNTFNSDIRDLYISPDGSNLYVVDGNVSSNVYAYKLTTPWNISTARHYSGNVFSVSNLQSNVSGLYFKDDGNSIYISGISNSNIHEYSLSTAWDIKTATYKSNIATQDNAITAMSISPSGEYLYAMGDTSDSLELYYLPNTWTLSNAYFSNSNLNIKTTSGYQESNCSGLYVQLGASNLYTIGRSQNYIYQYNISKQARLDSAILYNYKNLSNSNTTFNDLFFKSDGSRMYVSGNSNATGYIFQYDLSSSWNVASASLVSIVPVEQDKEPHGLFFKPEGDKLYLVGKNENKLYQYSLSTAWDVTSIIFDSKYLNLNTLLQINTPRNISISSSGTTGYITDFTTSKVYQTAIKTAWDISSSEYGITSFSGSKGKDFVSVPIKIGDQNQIAGKIGSNDQKTYLSIPIDSWQGNTITIKNDYINGTYISSLLESSPFLIKLNQHILPEYFYARSMYVEGSYKKLVKTFDISNTSGNYTANLAVEVIGKSFVKGYLDNTTPFNSFYLLDNYNVKCEIPTKSKVLSFEVYYYTVPAIEPGDSVSIGSTIYTVDSTSYVPNTSPTYNSYLTANSVYKIIVNKNIDTAISSSIELVNVSEDLLGTAVNVEANSVSIEYDSSVYPSVSYELVDKKIYSIVKLT